MIELFRRGKRGWVKVGEYIGFTPNLKRAVRIHNEKGEQLRIVQHSYWMKELMDISYAHPYMNKTLLDMVKREAGQPWSSVRELNW